MTINTAAATVTSALEAAGVSEATINGYASYVNPVVEALTERDYQITEAVLEAVAAYLPVSKEEALEYAERLGLSVRPQPEPEVEEEDEEDARDFDSMSTAEKLSEILSGLQGIGERISKLESAAQRNGISL